MIDPIRFILYILAAFRITILFSKDNGPNDIFDLIRFKLGVRTTLDSQGRPILISDKFLGRVIKCSNCLSYYALLILIPLYLLNFPVVDYMIYFFSAWGLVLLFISIYDK